MQGLLHRTRVQVRWYDNGGTIQANHWGDYEAAIRPEGIVCKNPLASTTPEPMIQSSGLRCADIENGQVPDGSDGRPWTRHQPHG